MPSHHPAQRAAFPATHSVQITAIEFAEGGWTTARMVERYCKARPFEERRTAPPPFNASRTAKAVFKVAAWH